MKSITHLSLPRVMVTKPRLIWVAVSLAIVIMAILPVFVSSYYVGLLTIALIFAIFAMSLNILMGYAGLPSLGHAAFFGIGAYTVSLLNLRLPTSNFTLEFVAGLGATLLFAAGFAALVLRAKEFYFLMITFALAQCLWGLAFKWRSFTGGDDGLPGVSRPDLGFLNWELTSSINYYYFVFILFIIATILIYLIVHSPFGQALKGIRENESRMISIGYDVWLYKYVAIILSSIFAGLAGVLFAYYNAFINPSYLHVLNSIEVFIMVTIGGSGTFMGPIVGAGIIVFLKNFISTYTVHWPLILGLIFVLVMLYAREGIVGFVMHQFRPKTPRDNNLKTSGREAYTDE